MSRVVEFCGLPGAGKTTLARQVADAVTDRGLQCTVVDASISAAASRPARVARKTRLAAVELCRHPLASTAAARHMMSSGQRSPRDVVAVLAQWLAVQRTIAGTRDRPGIHLVEEGVVQTLWTLGLRGRRDGVRPLAERVPARTRADLLVVVDAPIEVLQRRLFTRASQHSRTQQLVAGEQLDELRRGQLLLEALVSWMPAPVVRVSNDAPDATPRLAAQVADLL